MAATARAVVSLRDIMSEQREQRAERDRAAHQTLVDMALTDEQFAALLQAGFDGEYLGSTDSQWWRALLRPQTC